MSSIAETMFLIFLGGAIAFFTEDEIIKGILSLIVGALVSLCIDFVEHRKNSYPKRSQLQVVQV